MVANFYPYILAKFSYSQKSNMGFPGGSLIKNPPANADAVDAGLIPGSGRSPGAGNGTHCSNFAWKNPMDREL